MTGGAGPVSGTTNEMEETDADALPEDPALGVAIAALYPVAWSGHGTDLYSQERGGDRPVQDQRQTGRGQAGGFLQRSGFPRCFPGRLNRHETGQYPVGLRPPAASDRPAGLRPGRGSAEALRRQSGRPRRSERATPGRPESRRDFPPAESHVLQGLEQRALVEVP